MTQSARAVRRATTVGLNSAVHRSGALTRAGLLERMFTFAFRGLVYPQIWEDPVVDMAALNIRPTDHIVAIASGGCNVLSYLTANPARISAVDLNGAHIALGYLKLAALRQLPDHEAVLALFRRCRASANVDAYDHAHQAASRCRCPAPIGKAGSRNGRRRIARLRQQFLPPRPARQLHRRRPFAGARARLRSARRCSRHRRLQGTAPAFRRHLAPVFDEAAPALADPAAGLALRARHSARAIPLCSRNDLPGGIAAVLRQRLERLACGFDIKTNYFAWQAFGRRYARGPDAPLPPYLQRGNFETCAARARPRAASEQRSMTEFLKSEAGAERRLLRAARCPGLDERRRPHRALDARSHVPRGPAARVIFRTAADERLLPGRIPQRDPRCVVVTTGAASRELGRQDRSAIYGAFHLYTLKDRAA